METNLDTVLKKLREMSTGRYKGKPIGVDTLSLVCNVNTSHMEQILLETGSKGKCVYIPR